MSTAKKNEKGEMKNQNEKGRDVRQTNISAAKAVADVVRTSLGPRGMDKMIQDGKGEVLITNDGATIMKQMEVIHPTAKMLVEISKAQDIEAGDGTTSVVVLAGALLEATQNLLDKGIHPTQISESFHTALMKSMEILHDICMPVELSDRDSLIQCVNTSLSSKVVSGNSQTLSPIAVDAVLKIVNPLLADNVDLRDIKVCKSVSGTIEDTEMIDGIVFTQNKISHAPGAPTRFQNPKIALIQFCLSPPKTDIDQSVVVKDYSAMDRIMKEERKYIAGLISKIVKSGANVLLVQKSILRDAVSDLALHFLAKKGIMVVKDIEREEVEFICKTLGSVPVAHIDQLTPEKMGTCKLIEEQSLSDDSKVLKLTGVNPDAHTVSILVRGSNKLIVDEAERSLHDALCVVRAIVKSKGLVVGGGAPEIEIAYQLQKHARTQKGVESLCTRAYAEALEVIPYTLAENAGLSPINIVTELRNKHANGERQAGISLRRFGISDNIANENVVQPMLITQSAMNLATECVRMILKIDDIVLSVR